MEILAERIDLDTGDTIPPGYRFSAASVEWDRGEALDRSRIRLHGPDRGLIVSPEPLAYQRVIIYDDTGIEIARLVASRTCVMSLNSNSHGADGREQP